MTAPDATLEYLNRWHGGEPEALHRLLEVHLPRLHDFVRRNLQRELHELRREEDSLDFVQTVALKVLAYIPPVVPENGEQFQGLLRTFVRNEMRNQLRSPRLQRRRDAHDSFGDTVLDLRAASGSSIVPDQKAEKRERGEIMRAWVALALQFLDDEERSILEMRAVEGLSWKEIAEVLGTSEDAARMRFQRLQPRLANTLRRLRSGSVADLLQQSGTS